MIVTSSILSVCNLLSLVVVSIWHEHLSSESWAEQVSTGVVLGPETWSHHDQGPALSALLSQSKVRCQDTPQEEIPGPWYVHKHNGLKAVRLW